MPIILTEMGWLGANTQVLDKDLDRSTLTQHNSKLSTNAQEIEQQDRIN
jgi:hypothetical protein